MRALWLTCVSIVPTSTPYVDIQGATMKALARSSARLVAFYVSCTDDPKRP
jgi:hypothetical protein